MVLGIVAEYNPFHNGHLYHILKSKELTNDDYTIAVLGGNIKWSRFSNRTTNHL